MAKSAAQIVSRRHGCERRNIKPAAATTLYGMCLAFRNASGFGVNTTGSGLFRFAGVVQESGVDNSSGAAGDKDGWCYPEGVFLLTGAGTFTQADVDKKVYATDNFTITLDGAATGAVLIGTVNEFYSTTQLWVELIEHEAKGSIHAISLDGLKLARGSSAFDGSNPTTIATGLASVTSFVATLRGASAPGDNTSVLTVNDNATAGSIDVYAWKNTGGTDPTLVASTGTETFDWIAIGY